MDSLLNLFSKNAIGLCITDENGICIEVNEEFLKIFGVDKKDIISFHFTSLVTINQFKSFNKVFEKLKLNEEVPIEFNFQKADGTFQVLNFSSEWNGEALIQTDRKSVV